MATLDECKVSGEAAVRALIDGTTGQVRDRFHSVMLLHQVLRGELGFGLRENQEFGPAGGRQLIYTSQSIGGHFDRTVMVRVKTRGNGRGPRTGEPHMAISLVQGGLGWDAERAKFTAAGRLSGKLITGDDGPHSPFTVVMGGKYDGPDQDTWANRCHFNLPTPFNDAGAASLTPE